MNMPKFVSRATSIYTILLDLSTFTTQNKDTSVCLSRLSVICEVYFIAKNILAPNLYPH